MSTEAVNAFNNPITIGKVTFDSRIIGPSGNPDYFDLTEYVNDRMSIADFNRKIDAMQDPDFAYIISSYREAASAAKNAGCKVCYITANTGTLLGQFISPASNTRVDEWGGAFFNRMRLPYRVIEEVRDVIEDECILEFRFSGAEFIPDGYTVEEGICIAKALDEMVDILHVTAGIDTHKDGFITDNPQLDLLHGSNVRLAKEIKPYVNCCIATEAGLGNLRMIKDIINNKMVDLIYCDR